MRRTRAGCASFWPKRVWKFRWSTSIWPSSTTRRRLYSAVNPFQGVPALELDDGDVIAESIAICRYFEELHPEPRAVRDRRARARGSRDVAAAGRALPAVPDRAGLPALPSGGESSGIAADPRMGGSEPRQGARLHGAGSTPRWPAGRSSRATASASPTSPAWSRSISHGRRASRSPRRSRTSTAGARRSRRARAPPPEASAYFFSSRAIRLDVSQRRPPIAWTSE